MDDNQARRSYDHRICKRLWEQYPLIMHVTVSAVTAVFVLSGIYFKFQAYGAEVDRHDLVIMAIMEKQNNSENHLGRMDQKLDDLINFLHVPHGGQ